ncbi:hypothetical protein MTO96_036992 [Rhipicephalus appendiculatus]
MCNPVKRTQAVGGVQERASLTAHAYNRRTRAPVMENLHVTNSSDNLVSVRSDALSRLFNVFLSVHRHSADIETPDKQWLSKDPNNTLGLVLRCNTLYKHTSAKFLIYSEISEMI